MQQKITPKIVAEFLNKELNVKKIKDESVNGLQYDSKKEVKKIAFTLDADLGSFAKAKKQKADLIIVHHGLNWIGQKKDFLYKKRMDFLKKNKISLYAVHLPLDSHEKYGINACLAKILGLKKLKRFGVYHGQTISYRGEFKKAIKIEEIAKTLNKKIGANCKTFSHGKDKIKTIGLVGGGGSFAIDEAAKKKLDCFLTGEINLARYNRALDQKLNLIIAGHYATEKIGIKALMPLIAERFKMPCIFIDDKKDL